MVDAQTASIVFAGMSIGLAAIYYALTLRNTQRNQQLQLETRQIQMFTQFMERTASAQYMNEFKEIISWTWNDFDAFWEKYGREKNPDDWWRLMTAMAPMEHLGILLKEGMIDPMLLHHWALHMLTLWDKFEPIIMEWRRRFENPPKGMFLEWFEDLVIALREVREIDIQNFDERLAQRKRRREALGMPTY
jgi:hypothetical protein